MLNQKDHIEQSIPCFWQLAHKQFKAQQKNLLSSTLNIITFAFCDPSIRFKVSLKKEEKLSETFCIDKIIKTRILVYKNRDGFRKISMWFLFLYFYTV